MNQEEIKNRSLEKEINNLREKVSELSITNQTQQVETQTLKIELSNFAEIDIDVVAG